MGGLNFVEIAKTATNDEPPENEQLLIASKVDNFDVYLEGLRNVHSKEMYEQKLLFSENQKKDAEISSLKNELAKMGFALAITKAELLSELIVAERKVIQLQIELNNANVVPTIMSTLDASTKGAAGATSPVKDISAPKFKYKCIQCNKVYKTASNCRQHFRTKHLGVRVPCKFCDKTFSRNSTLQMHLKRMHK